MLTWKSGWSTCSAIPGHRDEQTVVNTQVLGESWSSLMGWSDKLDPSQLLVTGHNSATVASSVSTQHYWSHCTIVCHQTKADKLALMEATVNM